MKKNLLGLAFLAMLPSVSNAQIFQEDFDGNGPGMSAWTTIDVDGKNPAPAVNFITNGWNRIDRLGVNGNFGGPAGNYAAMSTSWYSPAATSNDWLISPVIDLTAAVSPELSFEIKSQDPDFPDGYKLMLSTTGGNTVADFDVTLYSNPAEDAEWVTRTVDLKSYVGKSVRIAWVNNTNDAFMLMVDNIIVNDNNTNAEAIFNESFEADSPTRANWTQENVLGDAQWTFATGSTGGLTTAHGGTLNARFVSVAGTNSPVTKLVTPQINAGSGQAYLDFYYANPDWLGDINPLKVYYKLNDSSDWVLLFTENGSKNSWTNKKIQLPEVSSTMKFAFEGINNYGRANVIDDVQVFAGEIPPLPPLPEVCGIENVSNELENGIGNTISFTYANDFRVNAVSKIDVSQISFNLITATSGISTATFAIVEDQDGVPGDNVIYTFTGAPTATENIGENFGFSFSKYTYDLPEVVTLENTTDTHKRYWLKVEGVQPNSGTNAYWEVTSVDNSEFPMVVFDTTTQTWTELPNEGVFTVTGECSSLTPEPGEDCSQATPSNGFENGFGSLIAAEIGNDFQIEANTTFNLNKVSVNMMSSTGINSASVNIYENNNGYPGALIKTFSATPTREVVGSAFGFDVSTYTFDLPEAVQLQAPADQSATYWIGISNAVVASGTNAYWEGTSILTNTTYRTKFKNASGWADLSDPDWDGVFSISGECASLAIDNEIVNVDKLSFYPNPVQDKLFVQYNKVISSIEVYNLTGQNVLSAKLNTKDGSVNLANLPKGVYVVNAKLADGTNQTFKVIKK
ncbi:MAG: choice-of-anchor J domain-containing protein [Flavobacteriaceae bacterium]|nr:choice-of-anchor J domain-containing protein [Candidatus Onthonaster equi]